MKKYKNKELHCAVEETLAVVGAKWSVLVIHALTGGIKRFGELEKELTGISPRTLSLRLSHLESSGVVSKKIYPMVPPKVEYQLTPLGKKLAPVLSALNHWGDLYMAQHGKKKSTK